ncbi:hypothetical protein ACHAWF_003082 [Thalassiosira exigua]
MLFSSSNSSPPRPPPSVSSRIGQAFESITSTTSQTVSKATEKATQAATEATEIAAKNANTTASKATKNIRHSLANAKVKAKDAGEKYAWEAHRSISRMGEDMKKSALTTARGAGERAKESMSVAAQSASNRLKNELYQRIPKITKLPFFSNKQQSTISASSKRPDAISKQQLMLKSATHVATEAATKMASNATTQVQDTARKATRWLWWWGLAAVGVYGMSTTLTKEGVQLLKDMVTPSKESTPTGDARVAAPALPHPTGVIIPSAEAAEAADDNITGDVADRLRGRWFSSWYYPRVNRNENDTEPTNQK